MARKVALKRGKSDKRGGVIKQAEGAIKSSIMRECRSLNMSRYVVLSLPTICNQFYGALLFHEHRQPSSCPLMSSSSLSR